MEPAAATPLQRAVEVMDRLRSPGGCPWDAEQTHDSLARYLVEECYEVLEAIETGDRALLREELGDLLLQVLFHARIAQEEPGRLRHRRRRRRPRRQAGPAAPARVRRRRRGQRRRAQRDVGAAEGRREGPHVGRRRRAGRPAGAGARGQAGLPRPPARGRRRPCAGGRGPDGVGARLFALVQEAVAAGLDPETELRRVARAYRAAITDAEARPVTPARDEDVRPVR